MKSKRLLSSVLAAVLILSLLAAFPGAASADDTLAAERTDKTPSRMYYDIKVTVRVTEDANGWNDARIAINHAYKGGVTDTLEFNGLKNDFDDRTEFSVEREGWLFPTSVDVYTDFGGGASWRSFQADVTVYVNGVNVASRHITAKSSAFSSSDTTSTVTVDESKYPYPTGVYVDGAPEAAELVDGSFVCESWVSVIDQYGSSFESSFITFGSSDGDDFRYLYPKRELKTVGGESAEYVRYKIVLLMNGEDDRSLDYYIRIPTENSVHSTVTASFTVQYKSTHRVEIVFGGEVRDTKTGVAGDEITLSYPELVQDGFELEWSLEGGGLLDSAAAKYAFGDSDGVLTASLVPYSFTVAFDGNGASKGNMAPKIQRVGTVYTLPGNTFTNTGHEFAGWNTMPDGSGDFYANKGTVQNLSTVNGDVVTLYAQWKVKTYTVTFVNKMTGERIKQTVEYGRDAEAPEIAPFSSDENEHYVFTKWNKSFTAVKSNITVTSVHTKEAHTFVDEGGAHYCSVCGYGREDEAMTASVFGNGGMIVIAAAAAVLAAAAAAALIIKRKNDTESEEKEG